MAAMTDLWQPRAWWQIRLHRREPQRNVQRHYSIAWEPCLFHPAGALVRRWGRIGSYTRVRAPEPCAAAHRAQERGAALLQQRLRRGYRIIAVEGAAPIPAVRPPVIRAAARLRAGAGPPARRRVVSRDVQPQLGYLPTAVRPAGIRGARPRRASAPPAPSLPSRPPLGS